VKEGRLDFSNCGWSSTDEACPSYSDLIMNMYLGFAFMKMNFNQRCTVGFQLDPFGHSSANAKLFSDFGFDAIFLGRIDSNEIEARK
jgi:hypothetical protein